MKPKTSKFTLKRIVENLSKIPAKGFEDGPKKLDAAQKKKLMEMAGMFETYSHVLAQEEQIMASAKSISELCELAETYALTEAQDYFQQEIVKKDMANVKKRSGEYKKLAQECYSKMQQLGVAYSDISHILGRYYNLSNTPQPGGTEKPVVTSEETNVGCKCLSCDGPMENAGICDSCKKQVHDET